MTSGILANPRVAFVAAALVACVWLDQGPPADRYETLSAIAASPGHLALRVWLPLAFAYRRSADEELYFAIANAVRGAPYDRDLLVAKRGEAPPAFSRLPPTDGRWHAPYVEVPFEYPAVVLPFVLFPAMLSAAFSTFAVLFGGAMGALMVAATRLTSGPPSGARAGRWWCAAGLFLAQGGLLIQRLDAITAASLALAWWGAVKRNRWLFGLGIGLAGATKVLPLLLVLPMMAADRNAWRTRAAFAELGAGIAVGLAAGFGPMLLFWPSGLGDFIAYHAARGLHVESSFGALLSLFDLATGAAHGARLAFGSYNLDGLAARVCARASLPLLLLGIAGLTAWLARRPAADSARSRSDDMARAGLGGLLCIWLFGKVLSPQYLTWGIPLALATSSRRPAVALGAAMIISQVYLRGFYDQVVDMRPLGVAALVLRLLVLSALAVVVLRPSGGPPSPEPLGRV